MLSKRHVYSVEMALLQRESGVSTASKWPFLELKVTDFQVESCRLSSWKWPTFDGFPRWEYSLGTEQTHRQNENGRLINPDLCRFDI